MGKIRVLPGQKWSAHAALKDCMDNINPGDKVLILVERADDKQEGSGSYWGANINHAEAIFMMEKHKFHLFFEQE